MRPKPTPDFTGDNARILAEYAERPLSSDEKAALRKCREIYEKNPVK